MSAFSRRQFARLGAAGLFGAVFAKAVAAQAKPAGTRAVMQVSDNEPAKWTLALNNARNVQAEIGADNIELEIVVYGPGIGMLKLDSPVAARIAETLAAGVKIVACENTLKTHKLNHADLLPDVGFVHAGVVELIQKQQLGFAYIRV